MAGDTKAGAQLEARRFKAEWEAKLIGILNPWMLPLVEKATNRTDAEKFRDRWHAQIAHIMMPWLFPAP